MHLLREDAAEIAAAAKTIRRVRWQSGVCCPHCHVDHVQRAGRQSASSHLLSYNCRGCGRRFSDVTGTALQSTHVRLDIWLQVLRIHRQYPAVTGTAIGRIVGLASTTTNSLLRRAADCAFCAQLGTHLLLADPREEVHQMLVDFYLSRIDPPLKKGATP